MMHELMNRSAGEERFKSLTKAHPMTTQGAQKQTNLTIANMSHSTIGSSARRLPMKQNATLVLDLSNAKSNQLNMNSNLENTPGSIAATDTMMYLKQQEMAQKSRSLFEEGKKFLLEKNYKEAIKAFNLSIKSNPLNNDSKYYRAICYLDNENPKKCIQDLNDLIETDPLYN